MRDNPYKAPAPGVLADMCAIHAWSDHLDDHSRLLLERAAETIRILVVSNSRSLNRAEHLEAEVETYAALLYGPERGGAE